MKRFILGDLVNGGFAAYETEAEALKALDDAISEGTRENSEHIGEPGCPWQSVSDCRAAATAFFYVVLDDGDTREVIAGKPDMAYL
jgi:hypothetical protein